MKPLITYEGYTLCASGNCYKSLIEDQWIVFDTASQWVQYIKKIKRYE